LEILLPQDDVYDDIVCAVLSFDPDRVAQVTKKALDLGEDPVKIIDLGLTKALRIVGKKFEDGELFLMHLVAAAEPVQRVIRDMLEPEILRTKARRETLGKIVLGTVQGDIHDIGKNIVGAMWFAAGFEIFDLGKDVATKDFVAKTKEVEANIVGASALLSTSLPMQSEIVKATVTAGLRDKVKLMFGGAPVTEEWTREIGGDGYAEDAVQAVNVAKMLLGIEA
jgi:trimethylamine corrinoid protein